MIVNHIDDSNNGDNNINENIIYLKDFFQKKFDVTEIGNKILNILSLKQKGILTPDMIIIPNDAFIEDNYTIDFEGFNLSPPWIVRSSAANEDMDSLSNAGIYKSIVVNDDLNNLELAVKDVVAHGQNIGATPAVFIQNYIDGDYYGVVFSKFLLDNNAYLPIVEYAQKHQAVTNGLEKIKRYIYLGRNVAEESAAPLPFLNDLYLVLNKIEEISGSIQDIEFVVKKDLIYILQSRNCKSLLDNSDWWNWTKRKNTPIFPSLFRTQITNDYNDKYDSKNQYVLINKGETTHLLYNKNDIINFQSKRIEGLGELIDNHKEKHIDFTNRMEQLTDFASNIIINTDFDSDVNMLDNLNTYRDLYSKCVDISNEAFLGGFVLEKHLRSRLKLTLEQVDLDLNESQVFNILTSSNDKSSWSEKLKEELVTFSEDITPILGEFISNNDFEGFISLLRTNIKYIEIWNRIYHKYKWLGFNRIGPGLNEQLMFDVLVGLSNDLEKENSTSIDKNEILETINIKKNTQDLFDLLAYLVHLKDRRNGMYSKAAFDFYNWLSLLASKKGINIESFYKMSLDGVKNIILGEKILNNSSVDDLTLWTNANGEELVLLNKAADKYMKDNNIILYDDFDSKAKILYGETVSHGIVKGSARYLGSKNNNSYTKSDIIIATSVHPTETGVLANVGGIIVEEGGITSHISILAREAGIPCIINTKNVCDILSEGESITLDANKGLVVRGDL